MNHSSGAIEVSELLAEIGNLLYTGHQPDTLLVHPDALQRLYLRNAIGSPAYFGYIETERPDVFKAFALYAVRRNLSWCWRMGQVLVSVAVPMDQAVISRHRTINLRLDVSSTAVSTLRFSYVDSGQWARTTDRWHFVDNGQQYESNQLRNNIRPIRDIPL